MTQANLAHATVTAALAQLDAWRELHTNGVAPTHKRQLLMDMLYTATGVTVPVNRGHEDYVHYGPRGVELSVEHFDAMLRDPTFDWSEEDDRRELIVTLVDRMINDLREDTAPLTVFSIAFASYTPRWVDANNDFIEDALQPPQLLTAPVVSGTPEEDEELSVTTGAWTGPTPTFTYQWFRDGVAIEGETANAYTTIETVGPEPGPAVEGDLGKTIQVRVTATNANGSNSWLSEGIVIEASD